MVYKYNNFEIENYTDDTAPYICTSDIDIDTVISESQITASKLFTWFNNNCMKITFEV